MKNARLEITSPTFSHISVAKLETRKSTEVGEFLGANACHTVMIYC